MMTERCNHPLSNGRTCVHLKNAPEIEYEHCPYGETQCWHPYPLRELHRHAHSWQLADARLLEIDGREIDMGTGEVTRETVFDTRDIIDGIQTLITSRGTLADARRVLRLYGWEVPDDISVVPIPEKEVAKVMLAVDWHYHGASGWAYGRDLDGHDYEQSPDGKIKRIYSLNQQREVTAYARRLGAAKAGRKYDVPAQTIRSWMNRGK